MAGEALSVRLWNDYWRNRHLVGGLILAIGIILIASVLPPWVWLGVAGVILCWWGWSIYRSY